MPPVRPVWHVAAISLIAAITLGLALLAGRVSAHEEVRFGTETDHFYVTDGFYDPENTPEHGAYRWTEPYAQLTLQNWGPGTLHVSISGVGAGAVPGEAVLYIEGQPVNSVPTLPGQPWTVEAWGTTTNQDPHVALGGPRLDAPGDGRTLGRLVQSLDIYAPDARTGAWINLGLLALSAILLYLCMLIWTARPALSLICGATLPALFGPLVVYRDRWMDTVVWVAPVALGALLLLNVYIPRLVPKVGARWSTLLVVVALTGALMLLVMGYTVHDAEPHLNAFDAERMYQVSAGLAEYGLPTRYPGRETWTKYGFGQPLIAVPFYFLGKLGVLLGGGYEAITRFAVSLTNLLVTALTCWLLYRACKLFASVGVSLLVVATFLLTTPALSYARTFFSEPAGAFLLLAAILLILPREGETVPSTRRVLLSGLCLGAMLLFKPAFAIYTPAIGLAVVWLAFLYGPKSKVQSPKYDPEIQNPKSKIQNGVVAALKAGIFFSIGPIVAGIVQIGYNYLRYFDTNNPFFRSGYEREPGFSTPLLEGLGGLLFSPGKSIFLYAPVVILAPLGLWLMYRNGGLRGKVAALLIVASTVAGFVFNAMWWAWTGNFAWGPRLVMPVLPLLMWPLASLGDWIARSKLRDRGGSFIPYPLSLILFASWVGLAALGALVSIPGALVDFQVYYRLRGLLEAGQVGEAPTIYDPTQSPLIVEPGYLLDGLTAAIHRPSLHHAGMPEIWDVLVPGGLVVIAVVAVWLACAGRRGVPPARPYSDAAL
ncbi:MAG TPA: hypothetical protein VJ183_19560 [Chloroflexia bacterium]|nr:hypothetical protein [Chloroflexia bacterium]